MPVEFASLISFHESLEKQAYFGEKYTCPLLSRFLSLLLLSDVIFLLFLLGLSVQLADNS